MIYLLDANVLIDANRDYYPIRRVPEFWDWLIFKGNQDLVKIPLEIYEEIQDGNDDDELAVWAKNAETKEALLLDENADPNFVTRVVYKGYASDLSDDELVKLGRDPFLISYALVDIMDRIIVTTETSKPSTIRSNRHIPDVCNDLSVHWCNTFKFINALNFSTNWRNQI